MADKLDAWMKAGSYLPDVLRDFHDQKDVFKAMHDLQHSATKDGASPADALDFVTGQCYVIDRFLWFMARRGYTLQRSRARLPFRDLQADVAAATEKRNAHDMALLEAHVSGVGAAEKLVPDPACKTCHGQGRYVSGYSGRDDDGNAPIWEDCDCFIPAGAGGTDGR